MTRRLVVRRRSRSAASSRAGGVSNRHSRDTFACQRGTLPLPRGAERRRLGIGATLAAKAIKRIRHQPRRVRRWPPSPGRHWGRRAVTSSLPFASPALPQVIAGSGPILLLCDHASNAVPDGIDLGIEAELLDRHIAVDIGAGDLTRTLAARLGAPAVLATVSRLVIDLHRPPDHSGLIPTVSDGHAIPGNVGVDRQVRIARFHAPYHRTIADMVRDQRPALIAAIHSFTPALETGGAPRPWPVGILYNRDAHAARVAIELLRAHGFETGDNEPYSGRHLNMTLNRHAEANGIPSLAIEVRNDGIDSPQGVAKWADILAPTLTAIVARLVPPAGTGL
ncbi:MAG: N-formylglutamate amidohydrolase [Sphingomonas sp.]|nr:N-formylglutamate amidohydrolase [Sphingomonas sp.]